MIKDKNNNYIKDINPFERFFGKIDNSIISFYMQYNHLKTYIDKDGLS